MGSGHHLRFSRRRRRWFLRSVANAQGQASIHSGAARRSGGLRCRRLRQVHRAAWRLLATSGPGGIHLLNGLYDAKCDRSAGAGHHRPHLSRPDRHGLPAGRRSRQAVHGCLRLQRARHGPGARRQLSSTWRFAPRMRRRGVSHICIPKDIQEWPVSDKHRSSANVPKHSGDWSAPSIGPVRTRRSFARPRTSSTHGSRVAILVGRGALHCREEVAQLAETVGGPVVKALLGKAVLPDRSPYTTGGIGLLGHRALQSMRWKSATRSS